MPMVEGGTSHAAGMVYHILHTSSLNELGAILAICQLLRPLQHTKSVD